MKKIISFLSLSLFFQFAIAQTNSTYWVMFTDKSGNPYSVNKPSDYLTEKAITRRNKQNIAVNASDLPVNPDYIVGVKNLGVTIISKSKWFNSIAISTNDTAKVNAVKALPYVKEIKILSSPSTNKVPDKFEMERSTMAVRPVKSNISATSDVFNYGPSFSQAHQIGVDCMHNMGYQGQGMTIASLDDGFYRADSLPAFDSLRINGQILGTHDFVDTTSVYLDANDAHGMNTLSCIGGNLPGHIVGTAPKAKFWLFRTENVYSESWQEEINWEVAAEFADSVGVDIITSSLGYSIGMTDPAQNHTYSEMDGKTTIISKAAEWAARKGIFVTVAAGNSAGPPWYKITAPGDADSVLTVGAIDSVGVIASFSSRGLTYDGRIKPNTCARGMQAVVASPTGDIANENGTSFSTPITAGAVACLWQANPTKTNMEILNAIQQSASQHYTPDSIKGYGIPNFCIANALLTGIDAHQVNGDNLNVYPNPFNADFNISFYSDKKLIIDVELFDVSGRNIFHQQKSISANSNNVFNSNTFGEKLDDGIYILRLVTPQKIFFKKIVKE